MLSSPWSVFYWLLGQRPDIVDAVAATAMECRFDIVRRHDDVSYLDRDGSLKHDAGDVSSAGYDNCGYPGCWQIVDYLPCLTQSDVVDVGRLEQTRLVAASA